MPEELPKIALPIWLNKGEAAKLAAAAHQWFSKLGDWARLPATEMDPMTCSEPALELLAFNRDIRRFEGESLDLYRLRVRYAYANAGDAGSTDGFKRIFERLGVGYTELEERMDGLDWDIVDISLSDTQLAENERLLTELIQHYGRTCRRYRWKIIDPFTVDIRVGEFSNDRITDTATIKFLTDSVVMSAGEFSNDRATETATNEFITDTVLTMPGEFSNDRQTDTASMIFLTDTFFVQVCEFSNDRMTETIILEGSI